jgi:hypothetical protein
MEEPIVWGVHKFPLVSTAKEDIISLPQKTTR